MVNVKRFILWVYKVGIYFKHVVLHTKHRMPSIEIDSKLNKPKGWMRSVRNQV